MSKRNDSTFFGWHSASPGLARRRRRFHRAQRLIHVSGDSDLEPALAWIRANRSGCKLNVYIPQLPSEAHQRRNDAYRQMGIDVRTLPTDRLAANQFPDKVTLPDGRSVERPAEGPKEVKR